MWPWHIICYMLLCLRGRILSTGLVEGLGRNSLRIVSLFCRALSHNSTLSSTSLSGEISCFKTEEWLWRNNLIEFDTNIFPLNKILQTGHELQQKIHQHVLNCMNFKCVNQNIQQGKFNCRQMISRVFQFWYMETIGKRFSQLSNRSSEFTQMCNLPTFYFWKLRCWDMESPLNFYARYSSFLEETTTKIK